MMFCRACWTLLHITDTSHIFKNIFLCNLTLNQSFSTCGPQNNFRWVTPSCYWNWVRFTS